jgi:hypothetical protein
MLARSFSALTRKYGKYGLKFNKSKTHLRHQYLSRNSECNPHRPKNILQRNMCMETMTVFDRKLKTSQRDDSVFIRQSTGEDYDYLRSYSANSLADRLDVSNNSSFLCLHISSVFVFLGYNGRSVRCCTRIRCRKWITC